MSRMKLPVMLIGIFVGGLLSPTSAAQADARCEHFNHTDWHNVYFHNDTHAYDGHRTIGGTRYDIFYNATHDGSTQNWSKYCNH